MDIEQQVGLPLCSRLKYLNDYLMEQTMKFGADIPVVQRIHPKDCDDPLTFSPADPSFHIYGLV